MKNCLSLYFSVFSIFSPPLPPPQEYFAVHTALCNDLADFTSESGSTSEAMARSFLEAFIRAMDNFKNVTVSALLAHSWVLFEKLVTLLSLQILRIENRVLVPLYKLQSLFQGPNKLIKKRYDKMLDFDNLTHNVKKARDSGQVSGRPFVVRFRGSGTRWTKPLSEGQLEFLVQSCGRQLGNAQKLNTSVFAAWLFLRFDRNKGPS